MRTFIVRTLAVIFIACGIAARAQEISPGLTFTDGQRLTAAQLGQLVSQATIQSQFYTDKAYQGAPAAGDLLLVYSASSGTFHKLTAQSLLYTNTSIFTLQTTYATTIPAALFLFYDPTNNWIATITESNLAQVISAGITASNIIFYTTNGNQLPVYNPANTASNNPLYLVVYDTNGIPSSITLSNFYNAYERFIYTNFTYRFVYQQMFQPWTLYGTNQFFTNAWGSQTNWPIFSLFTNNVGGAPTNIPTLVDQDTIPINSTQQQSNTVMSLLSFYQYLTNKNALPPFTIARVQFSGVPVSMTITNMSATTGIITNIANAAAWTTPTPVSFQGASSQIPTTQQVQSNTVYYALFTNTSPNTGFQIYTNLVNANARTNYILGNGVNSSASGTLLWLTNFTSFNCDAIQLSSGTSVNTANYYVQFRASAANNLYYVTGNSFGLGQTSFSVFSTPYPLTFTTNGFTCDSFDVRNNIYSQPSVVHLLVNPQ